MLGQYDVTDAISKSKSTLHHWLMSRIQIALDATGPVEFVVLFAKGAV